MTREEALREAVLAAQAALAKLQGRTGTDAAEAYASVGMLFVEIARITPAPRPPVTVSVLPER